MSWGLENGDGRVDGGTDGWLFQLGCSILSPIHPQILLFPPPCPTPGCGAAFFLLFPRVRALAGAAPRRDRGAAGWLRSRNSEKMKNFSREEEGCCLFVEKTKKTPIFYYSSSFFVVRFCLWLTKKKKKDKQSASCWNPSVDQELPFVPEEKCQLRKSHGAGGAG